MSDGSETEIIGSDAVPRQEDESQGADEKWTLRDATRPSQYVPLCRNSQLQLMKKFAMKHLWSEAAQLMKMLLSDARHPPLLLFRYGMLVLEHHAPEDDESFRKYYQETMSPFVMRFLSRNRREKDKVHRAVLMNINKKEIILDVSALLFKRHYDEEITNLYYWLRNHSENHRMRDRNERKFRNRFIESCYSGYEVYMSFLKWRRKCKQRPIASASSDEEDNDNDDESEMKRFSGQDLTTIDHLTSIVKGAAGVNVDLFLASLLEMYESKDKFEEAVTITKYHADKMEHDLNAHLRHYDMMSKRINQIKKHDEDVDVSQLEISRTQCFRHIVRLSPSHELVREVCDSDDPVIESQSEESITEDDLTTRIHLMMNFLDYRQNMSDVTAWQTLCALMQELSQSDARSFRKFMRFFNGRISDYWECVHFNCNQISRESPDLIQSKLEIAIMAGVCSKYVKAVKKKHQTPDSHSNE